MGAWEAFLMWGFVGGCMLVTIWLGRKRQAIIAAPQPEPVEVFQTFQIKEEPTLDGHSTFIPQNRWGDQPWNDYRMKIDHAKDDWHSNSDDYLAITFTDLGMAQRWLVKWCRDSYKIHEFEYEEDGA